MVTDVKVSRSSHISGLLAREVRRSWRDPDKYCAMVDQTVYTISLSKAS